jgi:hypothetical protein
MSRIKTPSSRRYHLFGAAFFAAGSLACTHLYQSSQSSGLLRLGSRNPVTIALADDPQRFAFWLNATIGGAIFFGFFAALNLWIALRKFPGAKLEA